jgi:hypothetical protein
MDVPYINHQTGEERLLPEGMGESMGFEKVQGYTPPEVSQPADSSADETEGDAKAALVTPPTPSLSDAVDLVLTHLNVDYDDLNDEVAAQVDRLMDKLTVMYGEDLDSSEEQTQGPSLEDARKVIEDALNGDPELSESQKRTFRTHLNSLGGQRIVGTETHSAAKDTSSGGSIPATEVADPASQSTTEPQEQNQPGKSA